MEFGRTPEEIERNRKEFLIAFYALAGSAFLVPLGIYSLVSGRMGLGIMLLANAVLSLGTMVYSRANMRVNGPSYLFAGQAGILAIFLSLHGGIEGSGVYFSFPLLLITIMLGFSGILSGVLISVFFLAFVALGLYLGLPGMHDYPALHKSRILMGQAALCLMAIIFEWIRSKSYAAITHTAERLNADASQDKLTGLLNRRGFESRITLMDEEDFPAVMGVIDIDHFKQINDEYGHDAGDLALKFLGEHLKRSVKGRDLMCRWGGEEFVLIFPHLSLESGVVVLDQIRDEVSASAISHGSHSFNITFSAGVVELTSNRAFLSDMKVADQRLYNAKQTGRNRIISECDPQ
jgi:diguanylate cyclase (GGDEF)-like protein